MSLIERIFGGGKKGDKVRTPQESIQSLRETEEMLQKKTEFLEKKVEEELATAKKHGIKNKRLALQALKRKKRFEKQLQQVDGTLSTIEFQREALENASSATEVLRVMGDAAKSLKSAHKNMDVDDVHNLMDDVAEQQEIANEISEALSNPVGFGQDVDEDDLLAELEDLEQEDLDVQLLEVTTRTTDQLPSVPSAEPVAPASKAEDDEMRELEAWAT